MSTASKRIFLTKKQHKNKTTTVTTKTQNSKFHKIVQFNQSRDSNQIT